jgi:hypothetical protein
MEDTADRRPPGEAVRAYLEIRALAMRGNDVPARIVERITQKLRLAEERSVTSTPGFPKRLALSRRAAQIGERHLDDGDPDRALAWERTCRKIEPTSTYAPALHTRIHSWFESRLKAGLDSGSVMRARAVLDRWRSLMGDDHATRAALTMYATGRADAIRRDAARSSPPRTLERIAEEEALRPGRPEWAALRREVADALQEPFENAIVEQDTARATSALWAQRNCASQFPPLRDLLPIEENQLRLNELEQLLQPLPLQRPCGHVRHPTFALTLAGAQSATEFSDRTESIAARETAWDASLLFRQRASDRRRFAGAEITGANIAASDGATSASALILRGNYVVGSVGRAHALRVGLGFAYAAIDYTGFSITDRGSGTVFGNLSASFERALGRTFVASGTTQLVYTEDLAAAAASLTLAYHANANFALGVRAFTASIRASEDQTALDLQVNASGVGVMTKVQF